jgi:GTP-binding protein
MFLDEYELKAVGGKGGDGCCSFRREKYAPRGGPDGGDGGRGGDVVFMPTIHRNTLYHLGGARQYEAEKGRQGTSADCSGRKGADLVLEIPVGTVIYDAERGNLLKDLDQAGESFVVSRGGKGGRGNAKFKTATNRVPRTFEQGLLGEERSVRLSLKLIADVGLIGLPNAGKSTLMSTLSKARPKIADYPFTTLEPCLGIVPGRDSDSFVMADIPGLIEGAHLGKGLGDKFLRHVERTRVLLHLVDCSSGAIEEPETAYRVIRAELAGYSADLASRPSLVVATKVEDDTSLERGRQLQEAIGQRVVPISAVTRRGLPQMIDAVIPFVRG